MSSCLLFAEQQIEHPEQLKHALFTPRLHQTRVVHHKVWIDLQIIHKHKFFKHWLHQTGVVHHKLWIDLQIIHVVLKAMIISDRNHLPQSTDKKCN